MPSQRAVAVLCRQVLSRTETATKVGPFAPADRSDMRPSFFLFRGSLPNGGATRSGADYAA